MIGKVVHSYFKGMQELLNPFKIYFDTIYTPDIDNYRHAMNSHNLQQMFDFDKLKAASITEDLLASLRSQRPGGASYNVIQYKYSPLTRTEKHPNNSIYYISYENDNVKVSTNLNARGYIELDANTKEALRQAFIEEEQSSSSASMQRTIHSVVAGDIEPQVEIDKDNPTHLSRLGFYGDIELECRFITCNNSLFEDFLIIYNSLMHKRNPPFSLKLSDFGDTALPITTQFGEINMAEMPDYNNYGSLSFIGFNVILTTMFLSSYVKASNLINRVETYSEIRSKN